MNRAPTGDSLRVSAPLRENKRFKGLFDADSDSDSESLFVTLGLVNSVVNIRPVPRALSPAEQKTDFFILSIPASEVMNYTFDMLQCER
ncbi:MAG: hypothetical protein C0622_07940 [Desulfuromonas sp.]|nr:MAG: hypothetical protein C0622_07940 [Desulfuromonas sp.]